MQLVQTSPWLSRNGKRRDHQCWPGAASEVAWTKCRGTVRGLAKERLLAGQLVL